MRVPPQRSARSNTATAATSGGKRLSSASISASGSPALSVKKRKLQSEIPTGNKNAFNTTSVGDASTSNPNSKRKPPLPNARKTLHHSKKGDAALVTKSVKSDPTVKKLHSNKSSNVPLVGLKKIKIREGRVTVKKIVVTTAATKPQKKLAKAATKTVPTKKQTGTNINIRKVISAMESLSVPPPAEDQAPSGSNCGKHSSEAEDQHPASQKKIHCRSLPLSKPNTKKGKTVVKKTKSSALLSVPVPVTRTKKLEQRQKVKSVTKICLKKYPVTRHVMVMQVEQQTATGGKKKIPTRRKQITGETPGANATSTNVTNRPSDSPIRDSQLSGAADNLESSNHVTSEAPEKIVSKGNAKKAKDDESAIKKSDKKTVAKKKPKMEGVGKGNETGIEDKHSVIISVPTKDKSEVSVPKKEGKIGSRIDSKSKDKCVKKKNKPKPTDALLSKGKSTKKSPVLKVTKVISSKVNKLTVPRMTSSPKVVTKQQSKKKIPKTATKDVTKVQFPADSPVDPRREEEGKSLKDDDDSSTSDEITLDVLLLRQQQMKQENIMSDEPPVGQRSHYEGIRSPSSLVEADKQVTAQNVEIKPSLPLMTSVKIEESVPNPAIGTLSPSTVNTSDDEDLKSIKNRIKVKLEENSADNGREKSVQSEKNAKKKTIAAKLRGDDSFTYRGKSEGVNIKKEPKDETGNKRSEADIKVTSDNRGKERVNKLLSVKRSRVDSSKNGGSGSDTEQRARRMKLFGFWSGPKRHRVASLNALAKVHCLYENESRGALLGICGTSGGSSQRASKQPPSPENDAVTHTRTLRSAPGLRGMGKHWDMHNASSTSSSSPSSDDNESNSESCMSCPTAQSASYKQKRRQPKVATSTTACSIKKKSKPIKNMKKVVKRRRNRCELMMDLKDMVVRKRMASLNASAILAASYSVEKRAVKSVKEDSGAAVGADTSANNVPVKKKTKKRLVTKKVVEVEDDSSSISSEIEIEECDVGGRGSTRSVIEVRTTPSGGPNSNKKVAVIVNQDTDVTITGVYVNSTTRSTHHEGFCSIAGMQYRISSTSHTQTEATAVSTETVLHTSTAAEHPPPQHHPAEPPLAPPMKSYTPLGALSNMQPPGATVVGGPPPPHHHHHPHAHPHAPPCNVPPQQPPPHRGGPVNPGGGPVHPPISPLGRRHGCSSAFSAPPPPPTATYGPPPQHPQPPHHHHPHPPPQGQQDPSYIHGYYQPAGPLISTHHHHHSSSSSTSSKLPPAVLPTLEASPNPTPPPSAVGHSGPGPVQTTTTTAIVPPPPQQIVSATSSGSGGGGARSGGDESDNDVIITATSCSGGGEVAPPPPVPQPLPLQQHPHQASYRYAQSYPPPPTPSTPQQIHHQSYTYSYPHTQYYPSPPASASIQYSAVAANPPSLQQHHTHYHNQDLCYSTTTNYPPAPYFHHKSYSTPPPSAYHRRYIPPPHQYYTSDIYSSPVSNASQQNSGQSQQSQQMVVTGSSAGSASSYQPPGAPPPPPLVGVSSNPPPPLVDSYPPPVSIVDPYPPPPGYYTGYSAGPGAAGCYTHSPPTRSLFIDAAYQSCPCPMQSCPKNVHTGPLTGDGKGPHITTKQQQQQQQPVQESGASFHQLPLPPVALALPLEPPGALGPPSPARGSAGMPPPPSPATASARNPSHTQEEAAFQQRGWKIDAAGTGQQSKLEASKPEPLGQDYVGETKLNSVLEVAQDHHSKPNKEFGSDTTTIPSDEAVGKTDISRHGLLTISNIVEKPDVVICRTTARKKTAPAVSGIPLLMCNPEVQKKRQNSSEMVLTKPEDTSVDPKIVSHSMKTEIRNLEKEVFVENNKSAGLTQNGNKAIFRNGSSRKRNIQPANSDTTKAETEVSVPKRCKLSISNVDNSRLPVSNQESRKTNGASEPQDQVNGIPIESQTKCRNRQKSQPLRSNVCSSHSTKYNARKRKLDDAKDLTENKEPTTVAAKKKRQTKVQRLKTKIYPSRVKQVKKITTDCEALKRIDEVLDSVVNKGRTILEPLATTRRNNGSNVAPVNKKASGGKCLERKKPETKINGITPHQKKPFLRHHASKQQLESSSCLHGDLSKIHMAHANANHVHVDGKKSHQRKKSEHISLSLEETFISGKTTVVGHMLRSHGLRDMLSDQSSGDDTETNAPRGKLSSCSSSQNASSTAAVRRTSTGSRKDQSKKSASIVAQNDDVSTLKKQAQQQQQQLQQDTTVAVMTALSRKAVPKKLFQSPKWSNGWKFEGVPFESKVFVSSDDELKLRKCYPLMRHEEGDVICPRDCILLKSGPRKTDLPFVAKVASLWENPDDGEMMVSLLWYYRPEHTDHGRKPDDMEDEIFASKHKDINSVACIEDKCYVLTFNEYCRYRKCVRRVEDGVREPGLVVPQHEEYPRENRQPPGCVAAELVFFCRRVYDFRQRRILKNPG